MKMEQELGKKISAKLTWLPLIFLFLGITLAGLTGCSQSCNKLDTELESYIQGSAQPADKVKVLEKCQNAITKCPDLSSPYELMGDMKAKENQPKEAIVNYQKALGLAMSKVRIQNKIDQNVTLVDELERKDAVAAANEGNEAANEAVRKVAGVRMSEYPKLDESIRLDWCEQWINKKKESLEKRTSESKTGKPYVLRLSAARLDEELVRLSTVNPSALVHDVATPILENLVVQSSD